MEAVTVLIIIAVGYTYYDLVDCKQDYFRCHRMLSFLLLCMTLALMTLCALALWALDVPGEEMGEIPPLIYQ